MTIRLRLITPTHPATGLVRLLTADRDLSAAAACCAARAGAHLAVDAEPAEHVHGVELLLVGADLAATLDPATLHPAPLAVLAHATTGANLHRDAIRLHAERVAVLPADGDWLTGQLRPTGRRAARRLRAAGHLLSHADRAEARHQGYVWCSDLRQDNPNGLLAPYVSFERVARSDDQAHQSDTTMRSNFRSLRRDYPDAFADLVYANVTALGAFLTDLPPDLVDLLIALADQRPVYDDEDLTEVEHDDVMASWDYLRHDLVEHLGPAATAAYTALDPEVCQALWWQTVNALHYQPEHSGFEVLWRLPRVVPAYAAALVSTAHRHRRRQPPTAADRGSR